jgi:hypothetical protein
MKNTVNYEVHEDGIHLLTDCPKGKKTERGYTIRVGSGSCRQCPHFIADNFRNEVICREIDMQK